MRKYLILNTMCILALMFTSCEEDPEIVGLNENEIINLNKGIINVNPVFENFLISQGFDDIQDGTVLKKNVKDVKRMYLNEVEWPTLDGFSIFSSLEELGIVNSTIDTLVVSKTNIQSIIILYYADYHEGEYEPPEYDWQLNDIGYIKISDNKRLEYFELNGVKPYDSSLNVEISDNRGLKWIYTGYVSIDELIIRDNVNL